MDTPTPEARFPGKSVKAKAMNFIAANPKSGFADIYEGLQPVAAGTLKARLHNLAEAGLLDREGSRGRYLYSVSARADQLWPKPRRSASSGDAQCRIPFYGPVSLRNGLDRIAERNGESRAETMRHLLSDGLARDALEQRRRKRRR